MNSGEYARLVSDGLLDVLLSFIFLNIIFCVCVCLLHESVCSTCVQIGAHEGGLEEGVRFPETTVRHHIDLGPNGSSARRAGAFNH